VVLLAGVISEATSSGGTLPIRAAVRSRNGATGFNNDLIIALSDTGTGIDPDDLPHIFRPFFSAKKGSGMAFGLSVSESIIKNHGGSIEVESTQGQGTHFLFTFLLYTKLRRYRLFE